MSDTCSAVVATDNVNGITVSTVLLPRGWYETCLFDDRNGMSARNRSRVIATHSTEHEARLGHDAIVRRGSASLLTSINVHYREMSEER